jgi:hypothetical protein
MVVREERWIATRGQPQTPLLAGGFSQIDNTFCWGKARAAKNRAFEFPMLPRQNFAKATGAVHSHCLSGEHRTFPLATKTPRAASLRVARRFREILGTPKGRCSGGRLFWLLFWRSKKVTSRRATPGMIAHRKSPIGADFEPITSIAACLEKADTSTTLGMTVINQRNFP